MNFSEIIKSALKMAGNIKISKPVPRYTLQHFCQDDNTNGPAWKECFPVSVVIHLSFYHGQKGIQYDDEVMRLILLLKPKKISGYEAWQVHDWWASTYLPSIGYHNSEVFQFSEKTALVKIEIAPFIAGSYLTHSGHMIVIVDFKIENGQIVGVYYYDPHGQYPYNTRELLAHKEVCYMAGTKFLKDKDGNYGWCLQIKK